MSQQRVAVSSLSLQLGHEEFGRNNLQFLSVGILDVVGKLHGRREGLGVANLHQDVSGSNHAVHTGTEVRVRDLDRAPHLWPLGLEEVDDILEEEIAGLGYHTGAVGLLLERERERERER